jgi:hypothetical protein
MGRGSSQPPGPRRGEACLMRDAEDCVGACQDPADAERFDQELGDRLGTCGLERSAAKTRAIPCTRQQAPGPTSFDVLGLECRGGQDRAGTPPPHAPDGAPALANLAQAGARRVPGTGPLQAEGRVQGGQRHGARGRPRRWRQRALGQPACVLHLGDASPVHRAQSPPPAAERYVDWVSGPLAPLPGRAPSPRRPSASESGHGACLGRRAEASMPEEPGAGTPHAGSCAGDDGLSNRTSYKVAVS